MPSRHPGAGPWPPPAAGGYGGRSRVGPGAAASRSSSLAGRIAKHRAAIDAAPEHGLSQGLIESTNTKIRLLTRIAFGFRSPEALIALAMLALGGHRPALPGRKTTHG